MKKVVLLVAVFTAMFAKSPPWSSAGMDGINMSYQKIDQFIQSQNSALAQKYGNEIKRLIDEISELTKSNNELLKKTAELEKEILKNDEELSFLLSVESRLLGVEADVNANKPIKKDDKKDKKEGVR